MNLPHQHPEIIAYSRLLAESFARWTGHALIDAPDVPHALYHAPFALVSHGTEADPIFRYANLTAQTLWGLDWEAFTRLPSRLSAQPVAAAERQRLLDEALRKGYVDNYSGVRVTKDGRRFMIEDTILWNVTDAAGVRHGQAASIGNWRWL
jgi:hypothetical protein